MLGRSERISPQSESEAVVSNPGTQTRISVQYKRAGLLSVMCDSQVFGNLLPIAPTGASPARERLRAGVLL